jgi:soluble lytic murein transglycosylase
VWRDLVVREPLSWYGLLARSRLRKAGEVVKVALPKGDPKPVRLPPKLRKDPALLRVEELDRAGLTVEAGVELQRNEEELEQRLGRDQALALLLTEYPRFGAFRRAYQLAEIRGTAALALAPVGAARATWEAALPRAYQPLVEKYAKTTKTPPLFVYTIMHKETGFGPHRVSPADARGLLQVLPGLGKELAAKYKVRSFYEEDLFRPEMNIRLGVAHLAELLNKFRGQEFLAAAGYNGGVAPVVRWLNQHGKRQLDEFVELVGFKESREYIKRVSAIYARYHYLYTGKPYELPLVVNRAYRKGKIVSTPAVEDD